jgi:hypothetical protein
MESSEKQFVETNLFSNSESALKHFNSLLSKEEKKNSLTCSQTVKQINSNSLSLLMV